MEAEVTESADIYRLIAWAHANRKQLIIVLVTLLVASLGIGLYFWNINRREARANEALSAIKPPGSREGASQISPDPYLQVAQDNPDTSAGARALLMGAGFLFDQGKFADAQAQFEKFLAQYPENPLAIQASLGVNASLEAQGKVDAAIAGYKDFIDRHGSDSSLPEAKSALARLYLDQNKPDLALKEYQELLRERSHNNDSWTSEAQLQAEELLTKYPSLRDTPKPPVAIAPATTTSFATPPATATTTVAPAAKTN